MSKISVRSFVFVVVLVAVLFVSATPALAMGAGDNPKPACTVTDPFWKKLFGLCVDVAPVAAPTVHPPVDFTRWEQALNNAEQYLRDHSNGNNDPVDNSNPVKDLAWRYYCGSMEQPKYDLTGNPVCPQ